MLHKYAVYKPVPCRKGKCLHATQEREKLGCHCRMAKVRRMGHFLLYSGIKIFVNRGGDHLLVTIFQCPLCVTSHLYPELLLFLLGPSSSLETHLALSHTPEGRKDEGLGQELEERGQKVQTCSYRISKHQGVTCSMVARVSTAL